MEAEAGSYAVHNTLPWYGQFDYGKEVVNTTAAMGQSDLKPLELLDRWNITSPVVSGLAVGNNTCPMAVWHVLNFDVHEPTLIPCCILAAVIGIVCYKSVSPIKHARGHFTYGITFLMFACMMTCAMMVHCFFYDRTSRLGFVFGLLDVSLTSCIAYTFMFDGLVDVGLLSEKSKVTHVLMFTGYFGIFIGYLLAFTDHSYTFLFSFLYLGVIGICCGSYVVLELVNVILSWSMRGIVWLFVAGVSGFVGLLCISDHALSNWLCVRFTPFFNADFWWFLLSDVAMYFIFRYFWSVNVKDSRGDRLAYQLVEMQNLPLHHNRAHQIDYQAFSGAYSQPSAPPDGSPASYSYKREYDTSNMIQPRFPKYSNFR